MPGWVHRWCFFLNVCLSAPLGALVQNVRAESEDNVLPVSIRYSAEVCDISGGEVRLDVRLEIPGASEERNSESKPGPCNSFAGNIRVTGLQPGVYQYTVVFTDGEGNSRTATGRITIPSQPNTAVQFIAPVPAIWPEGQSLSVRWWPAVDRGEICIRSTLTQAPAYCESVSGESAEITAFRRPIGNGSIEVFLRDQRRELGTLKLEDAGSPIPDEPELPEFPVAIRVNGRCEEPGTLWIRSGTTGIMVPARTSDIRLPAGEYSVSHQGCGKSSLINGVRIPGEREIHISLEDSVFFRGRVTDIPGNPVAASVQTPYETIYTGDPGEYRIRIPLSESDMIRISSEGHHTISVPFGDLTDPVVLRKVSQATLIIISHVPEVFRYNAGEQFREIGLSIGENTLTGLETGPFEFQVEGYPLRTMNLINGVQTYEIPLRTEHTPDALTETPMLSALPDSVQINIFVSDERSQPVTARIDCYSDGSFAYGGSSGNIAIRCIPGAVRISAPGFEERQIIPDSTGALPTSVMLTRSSLAALYETPAGSYFYMSESLLGLQSCVKELSSIESVLLQNRALLAGMKLPDDNAEELRIRDWIAANEQRQYLRDTDTEVLWTSMQFAESSLATANRDNRDLNLLQSEISRLQIALERQAQICDARSVESANWNLRLEVPDGHKDQVVEATKEIRSIAERAQSTITELTRELSEEYFRTDTYLDARQLLLKQLTIQMNWLTEPCPGHATDCEDNFADSVFLSQLKELQSYVSWTEVRIAGLKKQAESTRIQRGMFQENDRRFREFLQKSEAWLNERERLRTQYLHLEAEARDLMGDIPGIINRHPEFAGFPARNFANFNASGELLIFSSWIRTSGPELELHVPESQWRIDDLLTEDLRRVRTAPSGFWIPEDLRESSSERIWQHQIRDWLARDRDNVEQFAGFYEVPEFRNPLSSLLENPGERDLLMKLGARSYMWNHLPAELRNLYSVDQIGDEQSERLTPGENFPDHGQVVARIQPGIATLYETSALCDYDFNCWLKSAGMDNPGEEDSGAQANGFQALKSAAEIRRNLERLVLEKRLSLSVSPVLISTQNITLSAPRLEQGEGESGQVTASLSLRTENLTSLEQLTGEVRFELNSSAIILRPGRQAAIPKFCGGLSGARILNMQLKDTRLCYEAVTETYSGDGTFSITGIKSQIPFSATWTRNSLHTLELRISTPVGEPPLTISGGRYDRAMSGFILWGSLEASSPVYMGGITSLKLQEIEVREGRIVRASGSGFTARLMDGVSVNCERFTASWDEIWTLTLTDSRLGFFIPGVLFSPASPSDPYEITAEGTTVRWIRGSRAEFSVRNARAEMPEIRAGPLRFIVNRINFSAGSGSYQADLGFALAATLPSFRSGAGGAWTFQTGAKPHLTGAGIYIETAAFSFRGNLRYESGNLMADARSQIMQLSADARYYQGSDGSWRIEAGMAGRSGVPLFSVGAATLYLTGGGFIIGETSGDLSVGFFGDFQIKTSGVVTYASGRASLFLNPAEQMVNISGKGVLLPDLKEITAIHGDLVIVSRWGRDSFFSITSLLRADILKIAEIRTQAELVIDQNAALITFMSAARARVMGLSVQAQSSFILGLGFGKPVKVSGFSGYAGNRMRPPEYLRSGFVLSTDVDARFDLKDLLKGKSAALLNVLDGSLALGGGVIVIVDTSQMGGGFYGYVHGSVSVMSVVTVSLKMAIDTGAKIFRCGDRVCAYFTGAAGIAIEIDLTILQFRAEGSVTVTIGDAPPLQNSDPAGFSSIPRSSGAARIRIYDPFQVPVKGIEVRYNTLRVATDSLGQAEIPSLAYPQTYQVDIRDPSGRFAPASRQFSLSFPGEIIPIEVVPGKSLTDYLICAAGAPMPAVARMMIRVSDSDTGVSEWLNAVPATGTLPHPVTANPVRLPVNTGFCTWAPARGSQVTIQTDAFSDGTHRFAAISNEAGSNNPAETVVPVILNLKTAFRSVTGRVSEERAGVVAGARIRAGNTEVVSDRFGGFILNNIPASDTELIADSPVHETFQTTLNPDQTEVRVILKRRTSEYRVLIRDVFDNPVSAYPLLSGNDPTTPILSDKSGIVRLQLPWNEQAGTDRPVLRPVSLNLPFVSRTDSDGQTLITVTTGPHVLIRNNSDDEPVITWENLPSAKSVLIKMGNREWIAAHEGFRSGTAAALVFRKSGYSARKYSIRAGEKSFTASSRNTLEVSLQPDGSLISQVSGRIVTIWDPREKVSTRMKVESIDRSSRNPDEWIARLSPDPDVKQIPWKLYNVRLVQRNAKEISFRTVDTMVWQDSLLEETGPLRLHLRSFNFSDRTLRMILTLTPGAPFLCREPLRLQDFNSSTARYPDEIKNDAFHQCIVNGIRVGFDAGTIQKGKNGNLILDGRNGEIRCRMELSGTETLPFRCRLARRFRHGRNLYELPEITYDGEFSGAELLWLFPDSAGRGEQRIRMSPGGAEFLYEEPELKPDRKLRDSGPFLIQTPGEAR